MRCTTERLAVGARVRLVGFGGATGPVREVASLHRQYSWGVLEVRVTFTDGSSAVTGVDAMWEVDQ